MILSLIVIHSVLSGALIIVVSQISTSHQTLSVGIGCLVVAFNLIVVIWAWYRIIVKKLIALAAGVIVTKYAILIGIIFVLVSKEIVDGLWFTVGLTTVMPTITIFAFKNRKKISANIDRNLDENINDNIDKAITN